MSFFIVKTVITSVIIVAASELSKRFTLLSSLLAALPLSSILIFFWIYIEQKDINKIATMSSEIFFLVIPSLAFFLILPILLKKGLGFYAAFGIDVVITFLIYVSYIRIFKMFKPDLEF
jgi:hypothetical protein